MHYTQLITQAWSASSQLGFWTAPKNPHWGSGQLRFFSFLFLVSCEVIPTSLHGISFGKVLWDHLGSSLEQDGHRTVVLLPHDVYTHIQSFFFSLGSRPLILMIQIKDVDWRNVKFCIMKMSWSMYTVYPRCFCYILNQATMAKEQEFIIRWTSFGDLDHVGSFREQWHHAMTSYWHQFDVINITSPAAGIRGGFFRVNNEIV